MIPNPNQLTAELRMMPDQQLLRFAQLHKNDPYIFPMAVAEDTARKQMRAQAQAATYKPQPTVADQAMMGMSQQPQQPQPVAGLPAIPARNIEQMADGGIAGYSDGTTPLSPGMLDFAQHSEPVVRMAAGGIAAYQTGGDVKSEFVKQYRSVAEKVGAELGVDPDIILSQWGLESGWGAKTVGQHNLGNIKDITGKGKKAFDKAEKSESAYKSYKSPDDFAADYTSLIKRNFPQAVGSGKDLNAFSEGLASGKTGSYATDPNYGKKLATTLTNLLPIGSAQAATTAATPAAPATTDAPAQTGVLGNFGRGLASLADVALSPVPWALKQGSYAVARPFTSPSQAEQISSAVADPFQDTVGKTFGVNKDPAYQQEMSRRVAGFIGDNIHKGASWIAKNMGIAEEDAANMINTLTLAAPKAVSAVRQIPAAGRTAYDYIRPEKGKLTPQQVKGMTAEKHAAEIEAAKRDAMGAGATAEELTSLEQMMTRRRQAEAPSVAYELQQQTAKAPPGRVAAGAAKVNQAADIYSRPDVGDTFGTSAPVLRPPNKDIWEEGVMDLPKEAKAERVKEAKAEAPPEVKAQAKKEGWTNEDWLTLGFGLLANKSPYFSEALGNAGLGALKGKQERQKLAREDIKTNAEIEYYKSLGKKADAESGYITEGTKGASVALQQANNAYKNWEAGLSPLDKMNMTDAQRQAKLNEFLRQSFTALGLQIPAELLSTQAATPAVPQGVKVRQIGG